MAAQNHQNVDQHCCSSIPAATDRFIPLELIFNGKCRTSVEYILLIQNAYKLLAVKQVRFNNQAPVQYLSIKFLSDGNPQLVTNIRTSTTDLATLPTTVVGLYSLLATITSGLAYKTSELAVSCITSFNDQFLNDVLKPNNTFLALQPSSNQTVSSSSMRKCDQGPYLPNLTLFVTTKFF